MDDGGVAGVLGTDVEVDEMRHDVEMSNVRSACSRSSWNGSGVQLELRRVVAASGDDVGAEKLREEEGLRRQGMHQRAGIKGRPEEGHGVLNHAGIGEIQRRSSAAPASKFAYLATSTDVGFRANGRGENGEKDGESGRQFLAREEWGKADGIVASVSREEGNGCWRR
jgi:hypothetical protein